MTNSLLLKPWPSRNSGFMDLPFNSMVIFPLNKVIFPLTMVIFPSNMVIFPSNMVIFPSNMVIFPSNMVIFPSNMVIFPSNMVIFPLKMVIFPSNMVIFPSNMVIFPLIAWWFSIFFVNVYKLITSYAETPSTRSGFEGWRFRVLANWLARGSPNIDMFFSKKSLDSWSFLSFSYFFLFFHIISYNIL